MQDETRLAASVGHAAMKVDVRVVAARNRDLPAEVEAGASARTSSIG